MRLSAWLPLIFILSFAVGCAKKPTMTLRYAEVRGVQIGFPPSLGVELTTVIDVYNPNGYDVAIRAVRGTVTFADRYTLPVDFRAQGEGVWLTADATTQIRVPVSVPVDLALRLVRDAYATPMVPFHIVGRADVTATRSFKIEKDDYSFDERGVLQRQHIEASLQQTAWGFGLPSPIPAAPH